MEASGFFSDFSFVYLIALVCLFYTIGVLIQRRYHPSFRDIPGPFIATFGVFWQVWHIYKGHTEEATIELHEKHGIGHEIERL